MGKDDHGIPVLYDSSIREEGEHADPDVISVLSHELLSPLTLIKGYCATLLELDSAITDEQKRRYLRGIESATNKVIRLLEDLRDVSRLEHSDSFVLQPTSLPKLLRQIVSEIQNQTTNHFMKFRARGAIPMVRVDQQKIEQVMTNLLFNAVKYSPQRGDIETTVTLVQDESELKEVCGQSPPLRLPCIVVSVSDFGIGIPEAELEKIFHRFYRVDNRLTNSTPGSGLGLYICRVIVEAHRGRIWARNKPSGGSILSFSLPVD
jgi:signal transduction histidine kinase